MRRPVFLVIMAGLAGCTAAGPQFAMPSSPVAAGQARLVIYQTGSQIVASDYAVLLDGAKTCAMRPGQVMVKDIPAGSHKLAFDHPHTFGTSVLSFSAQPGETVTISASTNAHTVWANVLAWPVAEYFRADTSSPRGGSVVLERPNAEIAKREMDGLTGVSCS